MNLKHSQAGITLLETMLVISIGALILIMGIRQYQSYRVDAEAQQVQYNVNSIMQAMARYYKANCYGTTDYSTNPPTVTPGTLNLAHDPAPSANYPINVSDLINTGYLAENIIRSPLVKSDVGTLGYFAQFNMDQQPRMACITGTNATGTTSAQGCTDQVQIGINVNWRIQVAVAINDTAHTNTYLKLLSADCLSSLKDNVILPCSAKKAGNYLVWERLPSFAVPGVSSGSWPLNHTVSQFTQMYTTNPITYLTNTSNTETTQTSQNQYFYCGS